MGEQSQNGIFENVKKKMSPATKVKEFLLDDDSIRKVLVALFGVVFALVSFEYHRSTSDNEEKIRQIESRLDRLEAVGSIRSERIIATEGGVVRVKEDIARLSTEINTLGNKIDKLVHRLYEGRK